MVTRFLSNLRGQWLGASLGMLALFVALGGVVFAHGGDPNQIHACVTQGTTGGPNVRIVDPNDTCPGGTTAMDWAIQGPRGAEGPPGPQGGQGTPGPAGPTPAVLNSDPPSFNQLALSAGFTLKTYKLRKRSTPTNPAPYKQIQSPFCPKTHPKVASGGYETGGIPPGRSDFNLLANHAVAGFDAQALKIKVAWLAAAAYNDGAWKLTAYIVCKK